MRTLNKLRLTIYVRARTRYKPSRGGRFQVEMQQSAKSITSLIADVIFVSAVDIASGRLFAGARVRLSLRQHINQSPCDRINLCGAQPMHTRIPRVAACLMICDRIFQISPVGDRKRALNVRDILSVKSYPR